MDFNRTHGLKKDSDFRKVYKHGKSFANRHLVMYILNNKCYHNLTDKWIDSFNQFIKYIL